MPAKRTSQMDQEDEKWECLNSFPRQEVKLDIFEATPTKFHQSFTIQNTYFSSSCVSTCSKVIIIVSVVRKIYIFYLKVHINKLQLNLLVYKY